jgi:cytochrome c553
MENGPRSLKYPLTYSIGVITMKYSIALMLTLTTSVLAYAQTAPPAKEAMCRACHGQAGAAQ